MTRRDFLATVSITPIAVMQRPGFHLTGTLTATDTERSEQIVNMGKSLAVFVQDKALWAQVEPMIGANVEFVIHPA